MQTRKRKTNKPNQLTSINNLIIKAIYYIKIKPQIPNKQNPNKGNNKPNANKSKLVKSKPVNHVSLHQTIQTTKTIPQTTKQPKSNKINNKSKRKHNKSQ